MWQSVGAVTLHLLGGLQGMGKDSLASPLYLPLWVVQEHTPSTWFI